MLDGDLDEAEALAQREVRGAGVRREALRGAADDDRDRRARACAEDAPARALGDGADALREQQLAVQRHREVGGQRQQVRRQPREGRAEAGRVRCEGGDRAAAGRVSGEGEGRGEEGTCVPMIPCGW
jgi:hypothetical protein